MLLTSTHCLSTHIVKVAVRYRNKTSHYLSFLQISSLGVLGSPWFVLIGAVSQTEIWPPQPEARSSSQPLGGVRFGSGPGVEFPCPALLAQILQASLTWQMCNASLETVLIVPSGFPQKSVQTFVLGWRVVGCLGCWDWDWVYNYSIYALMLKQKKPEHH